MPIIQGLLLNQNPQGISYVARYVGEPNIPGSVKRRRRYVYDAFRRLGTPVLVKHRWNTEDVLNGDASNSPAFDTIYGGTYSYDNISHGVGYCGTTLSSNEWYNTTSGQIVTQTTSPGAGWTQAPKYRGYGPGFIVYVVEPDQALDFYRSTLGGALIKVQSAQAIAPWYPDLNDNDLLINVTIDSSGAITNTGERYELKQVNPVSIRGNDRRGLREPGADGGNRFVLNQTFEMALLPGDHPAQQVETDR